MNQKEKLIKKKETSDFDLNRTRCTTTIDPSIQESKELFKNKVSKIHKHLLLSYFNKINEQNT